MENPIQNLNQNQVPSQEPIQPQVDQISIPNVNAIPSPASPVQQVPTSQYQSSQQTPLMQDQTQVSSPINPGTMQEEKKSSMGKIIGIIVAILIVLGLLAGGAFYLYVYKPKEAAKAYIKKEGAFFADSVKLINELSTDKDVSASDEKDANFEIFYKKLEEEKDKAGKAMQSVKASKEKNATLSAGNLAGVFDGLLKQYYADTLKAVEKYDKYLAFKIISEKEEGETDQLEKTMQLMSSIKTAEDFKNLSASMKQLVTLLNAYMEKYKGASEPEGYADIKQKEIEFGQKMIDLFSNFSKMIDEENVDGIVKSAEEFGAFFSNANKEQQTIEELEKQFFEKMHGDFMSAEKSADGVKAELIRKGVELKIEVANVNLESW